MDRNKNIILFTFEFFLFFFLLYSYQDMNDNTAFEIWYKI